MDINYKTVCREAKKNINNQVVIENYAGYSNIVKAIYYTLDTKYDLKDIVSITNLFNIKIKNSSWIWWEAEAALIDIYKKVNSKTLLANE